MDSQIQKCLKSQCLSVFLDFWHGSKMASYFFWIFCRKPSIIEGLQRKIGKNQVVQKWREILINHCKMKPISLLVCSLSRNKECAD